MNTETTWNKYKERELARAKPVLARLGFELDEQQPHISGERFLARAMTTENGRKLILLGTHAQEGRVVIKVTSDDGGRREIRHERECRRVLHEIRFAYGTFSSPREILFSEKNGLTIVIHAFIEQEMAFLERPLKEQYDLAVTAFKAQESAHASTYEHRRLVGKTFGAIDADGYLTTLRRFKKNAEAILPQESIVQFSAVEQLLNAQKERIEQYEGFLTHVDFVPHNFRVSGNTIYLLDHSSLRFGNKHEGWARFLNFMTLHNGELDNALTWYMEHNRAEEELQSLSLMRLYRLVEIICFYASLVAMTEGNLHALTRARVEFWSDVLTARLDGRSVTPDRVDAYRNLRDSLRTPEEKQRQVGLH